MKLIVGLLVWLMANVAAVDYNKYFAGYDGCFAMLDLETGKWVRLNEERCAERFSPCSTYKIAKSLMGLETGVVKNPDDVIKWDGVKRDWDPNKDLSMRSAFQASSNWYFKKVSSEVGLEREKEFVKKMHYGNADTNHGGADFWVDGTLKISADEECEFMRDFMDNKLPFSEKNLATVKNIMTMSDDGTHAFGGKTGSGSDPKTGDRNFNWFVGYAKNGSHRYVFATNVTAKGNIKDRFTAMNISKSILKDLGAI
jgi:beta-lactamase class D